MAQLINESFMGALAGNTPAAANTQFTSYIGNASHRLFYDSGLFTRYIAFMPVSTENGYAQYLGTQVEAMKLRWYMNIASPPTNADVIVCSASIGNTYRAQITIGTDGKLTNRWGTTAQGTTDSDITNQWIRCEWSVTSPASTVGAQTFNVFAGANLHTTTPTWSLSGSVVSGRFDRYRFGFITAAGNVNTYKLDEVVIDDTTMPDPLPDPAIVTDPFPYVWSGSAWVKKTMVEMWDGTIWVSKPNLTVY